MSRGEVRTQRVDYPLPPPSKCAKVLYYTWKLCSVVFSHLVMISLVVAYCILGAVTFEKLEAQHEKEVKMNISQIRRNTTHSIWVMTLDAALLSHANWTTEVVDMLKDFENAILLEMKVRGWDGSESTEHIQWTFTGALFYSIIVITTIGYGHIAPKTQTGKVVTIFYAILGIPLMLLCLSNIGDVMASSFRFLYWRVCCYMCTRPPPKRRHRHHHQSMRRSVRGAGAGAVVSASASVSARSTRRRKPVERAHSDTDCRYRDSGYSSGYLRRPRPPPPPAHAHASLPRTRSQPPQFRRPRHGSRDFEPEDRSPVRFDKYSRREPEPEDRSPVRFDKYSRHELEPEDRSPVRFDKYRRREPEPYEDDEVDFPKISLPLQDLEAALKDLETHQTMKPSKSELRSKSLPRPAKAKPEYGPRPDPRRDFDEHRPGSRRYDDDPKEFYEMHDLHDIDFENYRERQALEKEREGFRYRDRDRDLDRDQDRGYDPEDEDFEFDSPRNARQRRDNRANRGRLEYYERDYGDNGYDKRTRRARSAMYDRDYHWEEDTDPRVERIERPERMDSEAGRGRRRLRRLYTVDDSTPQNRYTPSPEREEDWSDEVAVIPRRSRPPAQAWGSRQSELYPVPSEPPKEEIKPVPIWLCVLLVASYIVAGTFLFKRWEDWAYLDAAYFCFITLTTIGFGDFVPAQGQSSGDAAGAVHSIALCSLYLLFGIALLAMSFNLVQEEVRANVAALATKLGIIKRRDTQRDSDTDY